MIVPSEKAWAKELDKICRITKYEAKPEHCELFRLFRIIWPILGRASGMPFGWWHAMMEYCV
jgi:hypothetical protein